MPQLAQCEWRVEAASHEGDTYRGIYTVGFADVIYVLHAFQKKAKHGIETPKQEIELVRARLRRAKEHHEKQGHKP